MEFPAETLDEAITEATTRFQRLMGDENAELPWSTHFEFYELINDENIGTMSVLVRIEFDRKVPAAASAVV